MNAGEVGVALPPDQLRRIEGRHDVKEEARAAFDRAEHEEGYGPLNAAAEPACEVAVVQRER